ncbi:unnamed protein product [Closterium sp. NIES-54]
MSGSPRSNNGSSVTSPSRPTASPAADNSHLQQQQQQQYQQRMYGMPLSSQPVHTSTAAASSTAAAATTATAASTAAAAVPGSSSQPGQQSNFVPTGPYQYRGPNTWYLDSCCGQHMCSSETRFIVNQRRLENPVVVTVANNERLTAHWMGSIVLDSAEEDFSLHLNEVLLVPRLGFNIMSSAQLMKNGITLLGEPGKFTLKYGEKKLGTAVEQNGVFVLNFIPERTTADSDNILSLGPWENRDDIDYTDNTVRREGVVPTSSTTVAAVMLTFDDQGLNDVENSREYMAAVAGWGGTTNMPTDDGIWGADEPDETTWGETPAERDSRLLAEAEQRVADMEILDSGRLVGVELVPTASDQESGELVLAPGEYVDVEVRVPPPNLTRYVAPAFDTIRSDGHQLLLSFFANAKYYLRAQGHKATGETWHKRLGHPSQFTLNNTIKAAVLDNNSLLLPSGLELKPVNRPTPCTICPAANLTHEPFPTHFPGAEDYHLMDKVYSDILNLPADGLNGKRYVITFTDASTRYVWTGNMTNCFLAFTAFRTWLPLAERESNTKLKAFQSDGAGEYRMIASPHSASPQSASPQSASPSRHGLARPAPRGVSDADYSPRRCRHSFWCRILLLLFLSHDVHPFRRHVARVPRGGSRLARFPPAPADVARAAAGGVHVDDPGDAEISSVKKGGKGEKVTREEGSQSSSSLPSQPILDSTQPAAEADMPADEHKTRRLTSYGLRWYTFSI